METQAFYTQNHTANQITRLTTLQEHTAFLSNAIRTAQQRVVIVSPFISIGAIRVDNVDKAIRRAVDRGITVTVYMDDMLNREQNGTPKSSAIDGVRALRDAGANVITLRGIHSKTLIRDNDLLTEGSFNWLSAVREKGHEHCREERTMVTVGEVVSGQIEREVGRLEKTTPVAPIDAPAAPMTEKERAMKNLHIQMLMSGSNNLNSIINKAGDVLDKPSISAPRHNGKGLAMKNKLNLPPVILHTAGAFTLMACALLSIGGQTSAALATGLAGALSIVFGVIKSAKESIRNSDPANLSKEEIVAHEAFEPQTHHKNEKDIFLDIDPLNDPVHADMPGNIYYPLGEDY